MAAALPLLAAEPAAQAGAKLAGDVIAHITAALGAPILSSEETRYKHGKSTTTKITIPAWFVVGGGLLFVIAGMTMFNNPITGALPFGLGSINYTRQGWYENILKAKGKTCPPPSMGGGGWGTIPIAPIPTPFGTLPGTDPFGIIRRAEEALARARAQAMLPPALTQADRERMAAQAAARGASYTPAYVSAQRAARRA